MIRPVGVEVSDDQGGNAGDDPPFNDIFGPATQLDEDDTNWSVEMESECYRHRDLESLVVPNLPTDACSKRGWFVSLVTNFSAIDWSM